MLIKTPYSYCTREQADVSGLDYTSMDFSVEMAVYIPPGGFIGDMAELMRHGQAENGFNTTKPGWSIHASSNGYGSYGGWTINASTIGNSQQATCADTTVRSGHLHVVMTWKRSTGVLVLYLNGSQVATATKATVVIPASPGGTLTIGGANKRTATYTPSVGGYAMPEFNMHFARIFNGELTSTNVGDLYTRWNGTNRTDLPAGITPSVISAWYMLDEVGDSAGGAGTGWIEDAVGSNHLKIVDTAAIVGGTQASIVAPSGSVAIANPTDSATGVDGNVVVRANGLYGSNNYLQYYIEADTANTFNTANLRNSGWTNHDGRWQPGFRPNTTYYLRCKARNGDDTGSESSWSSTVSFTTRAASTWYVRPRTTAGTYGDEDGTSVDDAWNGFQHNGYRNGLAANLLSTQCDLRNVAPGDTVIAKGNFGLLTGTSTTLSALTPERQWFTGYGLSTDPIIVKFDDATHPGAVYKCYKYTGAYSWVNEGGGKYSTSVYLSNVSYIGIDDGSGVPDVGADGSEQTMLLPDSTKLLASAGFYYDGGKLYVRLADDSNPENKLWYFTGTVETFALMAIGGQHVRLQGGSWYGTSPQNEAANTYATFIHVKDALFKYSLAEACFYISNYVDDWTIENCEISYCRNGVYGFDWPQNDINGFTGDRMTVKNCWIHDIGVTGWVHSDAHCVGWQNGNAWVVEDCLMQRSGSAIEQWGFTDKESKNNIVRRNVIMDAVAKNITFGAGISFTFAASTVGDRTGNEIYDNVIYNTDGPGIHYSVPDAVTITGNLVVNSGLNPAIDNDLWNAINLTNISSGKAAKATITDNVVVQPESYFVRVGGNGTLTDVTIDDNTYWAVSPTTASTSSKFRANGYLSSLAQSFTSWVAGGTFDQTSEFADPTTATLPNGFDQILVDVFLAEVMGDTDGDGDVDATDTTAVESANSGQYLAVIRLMDQLQTEGGGGGGGGGDPLPGSSGRSAVWSMLLGGF